jgi:parallel beta-helix repeat protein
VVIDGGKAITHWTVDNHGLWTTKLPEVESGSWYFSELFVNGKRRNRPRLPRAGYYQIAESVTPTSQAQGHGSDRFEFSGKDIDPKWSNLDDVELVLFHNWSVTEGRIGAIENHTVTLKTPTCSSDSWAALPKGNRFLIDNVKDALGVPGEWYLDRHSGVLTYIPLKGESPEKCLVVAPVAKSLLQVHGEVASKAWAQNLTLKGLTFQHTLWNIPEVGRSFPQAEADLKGALELEGCRNVRIDHCAFLQLGEYGVEVGGACKNIRLTNDSFHDLGAGGVKIGLTGRIDDEDFLTSDCEVSKCSVVGYGRRAPAAIGVWIGQSPRNVIKGNIIEDGYYTGVSVGWSWGYGKSASHNNVIELNEIGNIGQHVLSDMGGIYTLGIAPGTVLRGNFIHDINSFSYGGWGIYPDEGSTGLLIENNIVTRCKSAGFHQHYGQDNIVRNNIFAFNQEAQLMRTRAEDHRSFSFTRNIVIWRSGPLLASNWTGNGFEMDYNLYYRLDQKPIDFMGLSLAEWQGKGFDQHSLVVDPIFMNAEADLFNLAIPSPADKIGFVRIGDRQGLVASHQNHPPILPRAWPLP